MVYIYSPVEPKIIIEGAGIESPAIVCVQKCVISRLICSSDGDLGFTLENWQHLFACFLLDINNKMTKAVRKGRSDKEMFSPSLDLAELKKVRPIGKARSGENHDGRISDDSLLPGLSDDTALDILARSCRSEFPKLACLNQKYNSLIHSGDLYKVRRKLGITEHWVYLACILMPWEAFDPVSRRWMRLPQIPCDDCFTYADKESLAVGTELLVFGRELSGFVIWKYSLLTRNWSRCPSMDLPRCLFGSSSLGEIAIVAGGSDNRGRVLKSAELYNSELGTWETLPDMNLPRKLCSGFFMDGRFYIVGGMSNHTDSLTCGEEYNIETRTWRRIENMYPGSSVGTQAPPAMRSPPLVAILNNQLYSADQVTNEVKKYDKTNNSWRVVKRLPVRADSSNGWGLAFKGCGDSLLVIGGRRNFEAEIIVLHSWNPEDRNMEGPKWEVLSVRERAGAFVYNCAVMGC